MRITSTRVHPCDTPERTLATSGHDFSWKTSASRSERSVMGGSCVKVEARLYKLILSVEGAFFSSHKEPEKETRMLGSLLVRLPAKQDEGKYHIRHPTAHKRSNMKIRRNQEARGGHSAVQTRDE